MPLLKGVHYKLIGSSGFGKSCEAAAILDMTTRTNDPDHLLIALLDLEHKTSQLFADLPHVAELPVGQRRVPCVATDADEVAAHLGYLKRELDRRARPRTSSRSGPPSPWNPTQLVRQASCVTTSSNKTIWPRYLVSSCWRRAAAWT
jgi:hypothetical protein